MILKYFWKMNSLKTTDKEADFVRTFFMFSMWHQVKVKSGITDIIIVHPLSKKNRQIT